MSVCAVAQMHAVAIQAGGSGMFICDQVMCWKAGLQGSAGCDSHVILDTG